MCVNQPFPAYEGDQPYVFVSYSHEDEAAVYKEIRWLQDQRVKVWYDEGISPGSEWSDALAEAIEGCAHFVYFLTPRSVGSENCRRELNFAQEEHRKVLAVYLAETDVPSGVRLSLDNRQAIHKYKLSTEAYQEALIHAVGAEATDGVSPAKAQSRSRVPIISAIAASLLLAIGLLLYSQYEVDKSVENQPDITSEIETEGTNVTDHVSFPTEFSIAVLPFTSIGTDAETMDFTRGLTDSILSKLDVRQHCNYGLCGSLNVVSHTSALQFAQRDETSSVVADKLNVSYLLEGSVLGVAENLRVTARLIRAQDSLQVWTKSYAVSLTDENRMSTEVPQNIAHLARFELRADLLKRYGSQLAPFSGIDPVAVQLFLRADHQLGLMRSGEGGDWSLVENYYRRATEVDPDFALAYSSLANTYMQRHTDDGHPLQETAPAARVAIGKAIELDSSGASFVLAQIQLRMDLDYASARAFFNGCVEAAPQIMWCHYLLAQIALREGRINEASRRMATASTLGAGEEQALFYSAYALFLRTIGDYDGALKVTAKAFDLVQGGAAKALALNGRANALILLGRMEEARPFVDQAWDLDGRVHPEKYLSLFAKIGEREKSERILNDPQYELVDDYYVALGYLALGEIDNTFKRIEAGIENHHVFLIESLTAEWWDEIRDDPRFDDMLALLDSKVTHTEQYLKDSERRE